MARNINSKKPHGGKVTGAAEGNAPVASSGMQPTPSPTKKLSPDNITAPRASHSSYGQNSSTTPASIAPGTRLQSAMADVLAEGQDDGQHVLDKIVSGQAHGDPASVVGDLYRPISDESYPTTFGQKSPNMKAGTYDALPEKGKATSVAEPIRLPGGK